MTSVNGQFWFEFRGQLRTRSYIRNEFGDLLHQEIQNTFFQQKSEKVHLYRHKETNLKSLRPTSRSNAKELWNCIQSLIWGEINIKISKIRLELNICLNKIQSQWFRWLQTSMPTEYEFIHWSFIFNSVISLSSEL